MSCPVNSVVRPCARAAIGIVSAALLVAVTACGSAPTASAPTASAPTATATLAVPTPTSGPVIIYQDPLTSPSSNWADDPSQGCFFGSGYHVKGISYCLISADNYMHVSGELGNADIAVQVKQVGGPTTQLYGIGFGYNVPPVLYRFDVESAGQWTYRICRGANCTVGVGLTANPAIHAGLGATNALEVRIVGSHFDFFVNGTKVGQADDSSNYQGGPAALDGDSGIEVVFSNLQITTAS